MLGVYTVIQKYLQKKVNMIKWFLLCIGKVRFNTYVQAYLGDIEGFIPDYHNKANIAIKQVTRIFCFSGAYKSYDYIML